MKAIYGLISLFLVAPIWYYLLYKVLQGVNATDVMWLLYWVYVPAALFCSILQKIAEAASE